MVSPQTTDWWVYVSPNKDPFSSHMSDHSSKQMELNEMMTLKHFSNCEAIQRWSIWTLSLLQFIHYGGHKRWWICKIDCTFGCMLSVLVWKVQIDNVQLTSNTISLCQKYEGQIKKYKSHLGSPIATSDFGIAIFMERILPGNRIHSVLCCIEGFLF